MFAPDRNGRFEDLVLGYDTPGDYLHSNEKNYGALIGRYGNRIGKARFRLEIKCTCLKEITVKTTFMVAMADFTTFVGRPARSMTGH
jgi:hypothetical protein